MDSGLFIYAMIGFIAQLVDSALGMAFGSISSSLLLVIGFPPQSISATVHMAEIFGGGASAASHWRMKNIDFKTLKKLLLPALAGAVLGAFLVTQFDNDALVIWLGVYFIIIGTTIIIKTLRPSFIRLISTRREILGFIGAFLDAFGGAGWGEFVSSGLLLRGYEVRKVIGSLVTVEFIIAVAVSVIFYNTIGIKYWPEIIALSLGAIAAAPIGALICKKVPVMPLTLLVGCAVVFIGIKTVLIKN